MPGVPPDAVAQVKRGLRGLFSRKKRSQADSQSASTTPQQQQQQPPTETQNPSQNPTITTTAPSPSPGPTAEEDNTGSKKTTEDAFPPPPPGPPPGNNGITPPLPQPSTPIPPPAGMQEAKDIDLDPSSSVPPNPTSTTTAPATTASPPRPTDIASPGHVKSPTETFPTAPSTTLDAAQKMQADHHGMSATSGPLDDSAMMFGEGRGGADVDGREFLERERGLEDDLPRGEGVEEEVGEVGEKAGA